MSMFDEVLETSPQSWNGCPGLHLPSTRCAACPPDELMEGLRRKRLGQAAAILAADSRHYSWTQDFKAHMQHLAISGYQFTVDDVIAKIGLPPGNTGANSNNVVGAMISGWAKKGLIRRCGYTKSTRALSHGRVVAVWVGI